MQVTCVPFKSLYSNPSNGYKVLACRIADPLPDGITLNKYGNISISSYDFGIYKMNCPITWDIEPDSKSKYPGSYKLNGLVGLEYQDIITIEESQELNILNSLMTTGQAKACHKAYPHFVQMIAQGKEDEIDVKKIKGVKDKRLESYIAKIRQNIKKIFFMSELKEMGFSNNDVGRLVDLYADVDMVREAIEKNPYVLYIRNLDYSFEAADEKILAYDSVWATSEERCKFCALDLMHENELEGNTRLNANVLASAVKSVAPECIDHIKKLPMEWQDFYYDKETKYTSLKETYEAERKIADTILSRVGKSPDCPYEVGELDESEVELTEEQKRILYLLEDNKVAVLTGPGGSGKTMSTKALIRVLDKCSLTYTLLAPTGIASKVLSKYTGRQASTIHKYLVSHDMCTTDFLLIDEASMVGVTLMSELFDKVGRSTSIVLICDEAQLASISCGNLVHDILDSKKVPVARLTKIFRYNSSGIITMATDAREGNCDHLLEKYDDAEFIEIDNEPIEQVKPVYQKYLDMGYTKDDIMVLSPFNVYGAGTYVINDAIQPIANPKGADREFINMPIGKYPQKFTVGDKVLNTKNNYEAKGLELDESGDTQIVNTSIFNGDLGTITAIFEEHAPFTDIEDTDCPAVVVQFDSGQILFDAKELRNLRLGYAESCHKSQGSQAKAVIVVIDSSHERLLSSNILYVAFTRCQEHLTIIGDLDAIKEGLTRSEHLERDTWLKDMLLEDYIEHDFMSELDDDEGEIVSEAEMAAMSCYEEKFAISPELLELLGGGDWLDAALYDF